MRRATVLIVVLHTAFLPHAYCGQELTLPDRQSDDQVEIVFLTDRQSLAPGECIKVCASRKVLGTETLRFPSGYYDAALAQLHLETPAGELFLYWPYSSPRQTLRPLQAREFRESLRTGQSQVILTATLSMVNPSPNWLASTTGKRVQPNFRAIGEYKAWVEYEIPRIGDAPTDAWNGRVRSRTIRWEVHEVPIADRRAAPTAKQLADIDVVMAGGHDRMKSQNRLMSALQDTENEGLAGHIADLLKRHQPSEASKPYPSWWNSLYFLLSGRAYRSGTLAIVGPYLADFGSVSLTAFRHRLGGASARVDVDFLVAYSQVEGGVKEAFADQLSELARRHARILPVEGGPRDHRLEHFRLWTSWKILFALDILYDGLSFPEATRILGEPERRGTLAQWYYSSQMHVNPVLIGKISQGVKGETVSFTNKRDMK